MFRQLRHFRVKNLLFNNYLSSSHIANTNKKFAIFTKDSAVRKNPTFTEHYVFCQKSNVTFKEVDPITFERVCEETLDSLTDFFEILLENNEKLKSGDVSFSSGVLTVNLGKYGTYVINRQTPNKQIWLSSPKSGPKRYDFVPDGNYWVYKHNFQTLHELLQIELSNILGEKVNMSTCLYYKAD